MIKNINQALYIDVLKILSECLLNTIYSLLYLVKGNKTKVPFLLYVILLKDLSPPLHFSLYILVRIDAVVQDIY